MSASEETLALLRRIADSNDAILRALTSGAGGSGAVASDRDLDGKYGDPDVRMRVKDWSGPDMKGRKYSQCPAEFLDVLAESLEWVAGKADEKGEKTDSGKPVSQYRRADAARARGWAARIRAGKVQRRDEAREMGEGDDWSDTEGRW